MCISPSSLSCKQEILIPLSQMGKLKHMCPKGLAQGYMAGQWQSRARVPVLQIHLQCSVALTPPPSQTLWLSLPLMAPLVLLNPCHRPLTTQEEGHSVKLLSMISQASRNSKVMRVSLRMQDLEFPVHQRAWSLFSGVYQQENILFNIFTHSFIHSNV